MLPSSQAYNILIIVTCYCVHICILIFCYFNIIRTFDISANEISALRQADIVDEQTLNLELILKYHKIMTHRKVTILPEHMSSPPVFSGVRVTRSLVLCVCVCDRCLSFCHLIYLQTKFLPYDRQTLLMNKRLILS
jgi:hypothetical protein